MLLRAGLLEGIIPGSVCSAVLISSALTVPGFGFISSLYENGGELVAPLFAIIASVAAVRYRVIQQRKRDAEAGAAEKDREERRSSSRRPSLGGLADAAKQVRDELEQKQADEDAEVAEAGTLGEEKSKIDEYKVAKFDTLVVLKNSTQNKTCRIKLEEEHAVVKKWLGLHILHVSGARPRVVRRLS